MNQQYLFEPIPCDKYDLLSKDEMISLVKGYEDLANQVIRHNNELTAKLFKGEQKEFLINEQLINIKNKLFGKSSEKSGRKSNPAKDKKDPKKRILLTSDRYPNLDIIEKLVSLDKLPTCPCCFKEMKDSGLTEDSEYLTVIPRRYYVVKQKRVKYRCSTCQDSLITTPVIPRIKSGSSYSDEMVVDVALSKYCDLIPVERYVQMAARGDAPGIPANTLIQSTHNLADFLVPVYQKIKEEVLSAKVLHADETPHRMLEGDEKSNWYMWGFSTMSASYFENHDTRSGDVASSILNQSLCEYLMTDIFSGYKKATNESNEYRRANNLPEIKNVYCNAHARRKFIESEQAFEKESKFFIWCYQKIYHLEKLKDFKDRRKWQELYYRAMERYALRIKNSYSSKSSLVNFIFKI
jgi:transposase